MLRLSVPVLLLALLPACNGGSGGAPSADGAVGAAPQGSARPEAATPAGRLVAELGCGACHAGVAAPAGIRDEAPRLGDGERNYRARFLLSFLQEPGLSWRPSIGPTRMPDFHLDEGEALALTLFLTEDREGEVLAAARARHPDVNAERGREIFRALNCAGCHRHPDVEPWLNGPDLAGEARRARPGWLQAWLVRPTAIRPFGFHPGTGSRMPDFRLAFSEADSVAAYLLRSDRGAAGAESAAAETTAPGAEASPSPTAWEAYEAERLVRERFPCLGCHAVAGEGGRIGPDLAGTAGRRPAAYVRRMLAEPAATAPGTVMPHHPMPAELEAQVAGYLLTSAPAAADSARGDPAAARGGYLSLVTHPLRPPPSAPARARPPTAGEAAYRYYCAACHGPEGEADGYNARYLPVSPTAHADGDYMGRRTDAALFNGIHAGGRILGRSHRMPAFGQRLERQTIWNLVAHLRELCDCRAPGWYRDNDESPVGGGG